MARSSKPLISQNSVNLQLWPYRLTILIALVIWSWGGVDLVTYTSPTPIILGQYSLAIVALAAMYSVFCCILLLLLGSSRFLKHGLQYLTRFQRHTWVAIILLALMVGAIWGIQTRLAWFLPTFSLALQLLLGLLALVFCLSGWRGAGQTQVWRQIVILPIYTLLFVEMLLQLAAFFGWLPALNIAARVPYARVYWTQEGLGNSARNRYGWYYPDSELDISKKRIILIGDSFIEGLQVHPTENVGYVLESRFATERVKTDVLSLGISNSGPAQYLHLLSYAVTRFTPHEIIIFVFLGNDFYDTMRKYGTNQPQQFIYYDLDDQGEPVLVSESALAQEALDYTLNNNHVPLWKRLPKSVQSYFLLPPVLKRISTGIQEYRTVPDTPKTPMALEPAAQIFQIIEPNRRLIYEKLTSADAQYSIKLVTGLLKMSQAATEEYGVSLRLVTIPHFPIGFYQRYKEDQWSPELGQYDLFLPERALIEFANRQNIPILPLGYDMQAQGLTVDDLKSFYYFQGRGHFTARGHAYLADALYRHFYADQTTASGK